MDNPHSARSQQAAEDALMGIAEPSGVYDNATVHSKPHGSEPEYWAASGPAALANCVAESINSGDSWSERRSHLRSRVDSV